MTRVAAGTPTWAGSCLGFFWWGDWRAGPGDAQGARGDHLARDRLLVALKAAGLLASLGPLGLAWLRWRTTWTTCRTCATWPGGGPAGVTQPPG